MEMDDELNNNNATEVESTDIGGERRGEDNFGWVVFQFAFYVLVIICGVLGNGLIVHVYSSKCQGTKTTTAVLVKSLALSDLTVCVFRFRNLAILHAHLTKIIVSPVIIYSEIPDKFVIATTVLLTGLIALDRYDCVCRPLKRVLTYRVAVVAAVGCFVFAIVANLPLVVAIITPSFQPLAVALLMSIFRVVTFSVNLGIIVVCYSKVFYRIRQHTKVGVGRAEIRLNVTSSDNTSDPSSRSKLPRVTAAKSTSTYLLGPTSAQPTLPISNTSTLNPPRQLSVPPEVNSFNPSSADASQRPLPHVAWASVGGGTGDEPPRDPSHQRSGRRSWLKRRDGPESLQRKTTRMLFITSVVFIMTWLPQGVHLGTILAGSSSRNTPVSADTVFNLKPVLFLNNVVNPLIYGLANRRFRQDCANALRKLRTCSR